MVSLASRPSMYDMLSPINAPLAADKITKVIVEHNDKLGTSFGAFKNAKSASMAPANAMPYHPGALRYYKEKGIAVGE